MKKLLDIKLNKKGFTLVELLVAMAIIAVLIAIAAFGIAILQRNSRNTQRRKILSDIQLIITDLTTNYQTRLNTITCTGNLVTITPTAGTAEVYTLPGRFTCVAPATAYSAANCSNFATLNATSVNPTSNEFHIGFNVDPGVICTVLEDNTAATSPMFRVRVD